MRTPWQGGLGFVLALSLGASLAGTAVAAETDPITGKSFEPVTYDEVLENPDDPALNLRYARTLIAQGRLDHAATALQRILILNPKLHRVRLLYAIVLYRLDNLSEAEQEFQTLIDSGELSEEQQAQAKRYLAETRRKQSNFKGALTIGAGVHYDSNRNSYPQSDRFRVLDTVIQGAGDENADVGRLAFGTVDLSYDPGMQRLRELYFTGTGLIDDQVEVDDLDLFAGVFEVGAKYDATVVEITPHLRHEYLSLDGDLYARTYEGGVRVNHRYFQMPALNTWVEARAAHEDFNSNTNAPFNDERTGERYEIELGSGYNVTNALRVSGSYTFGHKEADEDFHSYDSHTLGASASYVFANQSFVVASGQLEFQNYDAADPFISATTEREDVDSRVRLTYGVPVDVIAAAVGQETDNPVTRNMVLSLSGEYFNSESNLRNYEYDNWRASALITKRFEF